MQNYDTTPPSSATSTTQTPDGEMSGTGLPRTLGVALRPPISAEWKRTNFYPYPQFHKEFDAAQELLLQNPLEEIRIEHADLYCVRFNDRPDQWMTRNEYVLFALQEYCNTQNYSLQYQSYGTHWVATMTNWSNIQSTHASGQTIYHAARNLLHDSDWTWMSEPEEPYRNP